MFSRQDWVKATEFHPHSDKEVLDEVIKRSQLVVDQGQVPVVVFDLDSTLFDVSRRSYEILQEWLAHQDTVSFHETRMSLQDLHPNDMVYSLLDVWEKKNIAHEEEPFATHYRHARKFWRQRFFGNEYLKWDHPEPGAVEYVNQLYDLGAYVVYLTGRDAPLMAFGTYEQLSVHGLPIEKPRSRLILKPKRHLEDLDYKSEAAKLVQSWGRVIASFENEPKNLMAMSKVYPDEVMNIFIETVSSPHPAPKGEGIYKIKGFKDYSNP